MKIQTREGLSCAIVLFELVIGHDASAQMVQHLSAQRAVALSAANLADIQPASRKLSALPPEFMQDIKVMSQLDGTLQIVSGDPGPATVIAGEGNSPGLPEIASTTSTPAANVPQGDELVRPENFGRSGVQSIFHYSDRLVSASLRSEAPYRWSGWFVFTTADGITARCTASLISRSVLVTAGHCVHQGGTRGAGFIRNGIYYPAYRNGESAEFGSAPALVAVVTYGWWAEGALDKGYDVALVVLGKRIGTTVEIGTQSGWFGFCARGCLQAAWSKTQLGYPHNYYSGELMTLGEHLEISDTRDYVFGSGMEGGSSGGPHVANLGELSDTSTNIGQWPNRNIIFAVTSWGFNDDSMKIQGASSLAGPGGSNNFPAMYNLACNLARSVHGIGSCSPI